MTNFYIKQNPAVEAYTAKELTDIKTMDCAIRYVVADSEFKFIQNSQHAVNNSNGTITTEVQPGGGTLQFIVTADTFLDATTLTTSSCTVDETFASIGISAGASINQSTTTVRIYDLNGVTGEINADTTSVVSFDTFNHITNITDDLAGNGRLVITHDPVEGHSAFCSPKGTEGVYFYNPVCVNNTTTHVYIFTAAGAAVNAAAADMIFYFNRKAPTRFTTTSFETLGTGNSNSTASLSLANFWLSVKYIKPSETLPADVVTG